MPESAHIAAPGPAWAFVSRRRGGIRADWTDWVTYGYLALGVVVMLAPVLWVVFSSFKSESNLYEFPPTLWPEAIETVTVPGYARPLGLFRVTRDDGSVATFAQVRRVGIEAQMLDPARPEAGTFAVSVDLSLIHI